MTKFSDLKLDPKVLKAIADAGYENPTPIQEGAIPPALEGRDVLGIAQTGTGKTASFTLPMITLLGRGRARARMPRSLVLCPTRELAAQVAENFDIYAKHTRLTKALLIGGVSFGEQDKLIDRGVDVLIATPGRLLDHFERGKLLLTGVQIMVVDEADRMLDMGFIPDIERIFQLTPFTRQTLFFSATMAPEIERITNTFLHAPERIEIARQATASETITQRLVEITPTRKDQSAKQKRELLRALINAEGDGLKNAIIFCNRKTDVDIVSKSLAKYGHDAAPIHGDLDQSHRTRTLEAFREGKLKLLVASDVAARGLDIPAVSHVINYDLPSHAEDYVHRIGRTGRAGRSGTSISIATPSDEKYLAAIETLLSKQLPRAALPEGFEPSSAAQSAPKGNREGRGDKGGARRRNRRDDNRRDDGNKQDRPESRQADAERNSPVQDTAPRPQRGNQQRDDRRRAPREDRGPAIVGMGDHVPQFMLASLFIESDDPTDTTDVTDTTEETPQTDSARQETKPKRRSRRTSKSTAKASGAPESAAPDAPSQVDDQAAQAAIESATPSGDPLENQENAPVEAQPETPPAADAPKLRKPRARKPKAAAETSATEASTDSASESAVEDAPKPKRTRRKKPEPTVETGAEESADKTSEDKPKPRATRSRRKKPESTAEPASDTVSGGSATSDPSEK
ncbi:DEAD/DEAH box helicase [Paracoccus onubensis]|uniref:DEAD-box ATP-dependent RNA helicase RhpA n=1 Tax=Paracoccus onubensis TaxID=1675788 RepID=A0A418SRT3_9RHOB|nr:DEAD/DEAH box helicase [Paracoccus onubensis]RJE83674.1 DEAD/DEAH box helicase [Paracoccus onubensis]